MEDTSGQPGERVGEEKQLQDTAASRKLNRTKQKRSRWRRDKHRQGQRERERGSESEKERATQTYVEYKPYTEAQQR